MSSMLRATTFTLLLGSAFVSIPAHCQDGQEWDHARARLSATQRGSMALTVNRWQQLTATDRLSFADYSGFLLTYPGFPEEDKLRGYAERALDRESADPSRVVAFFDRFPPRSNTARAQYALALTARGRPEARAVAIQAWRGGPTSDSAAATLLSIHGTAFTADDHDARMDALLWAGATTQAQAHIAYVSPARRNAFMERLSLLQGAAPGSLGLPLPAEASRDPGYLFNRARAARRGGRSDDAVQTLAMRQPLSAPPLDPEKWVGELLATARGADATSAVRIASGIDEAFPPGADVSRLGFRLRDDYTSLMWLGGTKALWSLGDGARAAPLFYRYATAARTPQTRAKGFYWAGRALARAGDSANAARYFEMAARYADSFYGILSLERLGRPVPRFNRTPSGNPGAAERAAFANRPLTVAVREVARDFDWPTTVRFFKEICEQAQTENDHLLVAELAREIGRRDLAVILGQSAHTDGFGDFQTVSFPLIPAPPGTDWTMVHAIARQESQFAQNAVSHAGARGLMQLMPGTAREQADKMGLSFEPSALIADAGYNLRLGDGYFARMMDYFNGSYPLAVAAYNAGPGNVNRWLRSNGDPRNGGIEWIDWIERIPLSETRNYVQRVLENAVVYEAMNPDRASYRGANPLSHFIGKGQPG